MYCHSCGHEIADDSRFCSSCGQTLNAPPQNTQMAQKGFLYYLFGALFILGGILPYLLMENEAAYSRYLISMYSKYSVYAVAAVSCLTQFGTLLTPLFRFSSCLLSIYLGLLLIKKESHLATPLNACVILHILTIVYLAVVNMMICHFPRTALSIYVHDPNIIDIGEKLIKTDPNLLSFYQDAWVRQFIISMVLILLAGVFGWIYKRHAGNLTGNHSKPATAGIISMIVSIPALPIVSSLFPAAFGNFTHFTAANALAKSAFNQSFSSAVLFAFIVIVGIVFIFNNAKRWILAVPTIGLTVALGFLAITFSYACIVDIGAPADVIAIAEDILDGLIIASVAILIAMFFWFHAVSKNKIPTWLQIALPASLPFLYVGIERAAVSFHVAPGYSFGLLSIAFLTSLVSLLVCTRKTNPVQ